MRPNPFSSNSNQADEFQKQFEKFVRTNFPNMGFGSNPEFGMPSAELSSADSGKTKENINHFEFNYKPKEVKSYLDRFVIKQDEAKKVLSVALCDHYHNVRRVLSGHVAKNYTKQNIVLLGPTGVGKTYLIRSMADLIGVPFVKADATKFSETGYVGADVEDLVRELVRQAEGDVVRAQYGIIFIDEIDKIGSVNGGVGRDVSGRGVQTNLLKLMEETEVPARAPHDIAGQIQAMMDIGQRGGKNRPASINTRHILFVVSGAFDGLQEIIRKRVRDSVIGFSAIHSGDLHRETILDQVTTQDFIQYGFEPEFIGRLPIRVVCQPLDVDDLFQILKSAEGSLVRQYEHSFAGYGIDIFFREDGLRRIAERAAEERTGARGLMTVFEQVFRDLKFELPSSSIKQFEVTGSLVDDPKSALQNLLNESELVERQFMKTLVDEFSVRFSERYGIDLRFDESAVDHLVDEAISAGRSVRDLCSEKFRDYQFGLRLIQQNTGKRSFQLEVAHVTNPEKALSDWVVASYRQKSDKEDLG